MSRLEPMIGDAKSVEETTPLFGAFNTRISCSEKKMWSSRRNRRSATTSSSAGRGSPTYPGGHAAQRECGSTQAALVPS